MTSDEHDHDDRRERTRVVLRPIANPVPLGFYAFGMGMVLTGAVAVGWLPAGGVLVPLLLITFVGPLELIAALAALAGRDTVAFVGLGLFAASWITAGVTGLVSGPGAQPALGMFNLYFSAAVLALAIIAAREKPSLALILAVAVPNGVLTGVAQLWGYRQLIPYAGGFALALSVLALVGGTALLVEELRGAPLSNFARRASAETALTGDLDRQLDEVSDEPGVRRRL